MYFQFLNVISFSDWPDSCVGVARKVLLTLDMEIFVTIVGMTTEYSIQPDCSVKIYI
jgi:hypothetical protein